MDRLELNPDYAKLKARSVTEPVDDELKTFAIGLANKNKGNRIKGLLADNDAAAKSIAGNSCEEQMRKSAREECGENAFGSNLELLEVGDGSGSSGLGDVPLKFKYNGKVGARALECKCYTDCSSIVTASAISIIKDFIQNGLPFLNTWYLVFKYTTSVGVGLADPPTEIITPLASYGGKSIDEIVNDPSTPDAVLLAARKLQLFCGQEKLKTGSTIILSDVVVVPFWFMVKINDDGRLAVNGDGVVQAHSLEGALNRSPYNPWVVMNALTTYFEELSVTEKNNALKTINDTLKTDFDDYTIIEDKLRTALDELPEPPEDMLFAIFDEDYSRIATDKIFNNIDPSKFRSALGLIRKVGGVDNLNEAAISEYLNAEAEDDPGTTIRSTESRNALITVLEAYRNDGERYDAANLEDCITYIHAYDVRYRALLDKPGMARFIRSHKDWVLNNSDKIVSKKALEVLDIIATGKASTWAKDFDALYDFIKNHVNNYNNNFDSKGLRDLLDALKASNIPGTEFLIRNDINSKPDLENYMYKRDLDPIVGRCYDLYQSLRRSMKESERGKLLTEQSIFSYDSIKNTVNHRLIIEDVLADWLSIPLGNGDNRYTERNRFIASFNTVCRLAGIDYELNPHKGMKGTITNPSDYWLLDAYETMREKYDKGKATKLIPISTMHKITREKISSTPSNIKDFIILLGNHSVYIALKKAAPTIIRQRDTEKHTTWYKRVNKYRAACRQTFLFVNNPAYGPAIPAGNEDAIRRVVLEFLTEISKVTGKNNDKDDTPVAEE